MHPACCWPQDNHTAWRVHPRRDLLHRRNDPGLACPGHACRSTAGDQPDRLAPHPPHTPPCSTPRAYRGLRVVVRPVRVRGTCVGQGQHTAAGPREKTAQRWVPRSSSGTPPTAVFTVRQSPPAREQVAGRSRGPRGAPPAPWAASIMGNRYGISFARCGWCKLAGASDRRALTDPPFASVQGLLWPPNRRGHARRTDPASPRAGRPAAPWP